LADPTRATPLPADARVLESALRLWRLEPATAGASLYALVGAVLARQRRWGMRR